jgi:hypothetical protein
LAAVARKIARWAADHGARLEDADPDMPNELNDRAADNWRLLLAIADAAGSDWPKKARDAARKLAGGVEAETQRVLLLADIREIFRDQDDPDEIETKEILKALVARDDRPWAERKNGKPLTPQGLRSLLEPFKVWAAKLDAHRRGYRREAFADAWERYLPSAIADDPPPGDIDPPIRHKPSNGAAFSDSSIRHKQAGNGGSQTAQNPQKHWLSGGLADRSSPGDRAAGDEPPPWDDDPAWTRLLLKTQPGKQHAALVRRRVEAAGGQVADGAAVLPELPDSVALEALRLQCRNVGWRIVPKPRWSRTL